MTDRELVQAFQRGDASAFESLYRRHRDWVASLAFRFCGSQEDALDVLQETFAYLFRKLPELDLRAKMRSFLYPVVKHVSFSKKQASRRQVVMETPPEPAVESPPSSGAEELLAGLPEEQREVVWMRLVDEFDLKEIAATLDIPLGTVKSRLHAALKALRAKSSNL